MDELGAVQEITTFDYTTPSGESRVRLVIPARKCFSECDPSSVTPDNPWFVLAFGSCGPPGATCGFAPPNLAITLPGAAGTAASYNFTTPPYMLNGDPATKPANPNNPSPVPYHSNVMRHWSGMRPGNPVQVVISCPFNNPATPAPNGTSAADNIFPGGSVPTVYTWQTWISHIQTTFNKFANVATADVWVTTAVVYADTPVLGTTTPGYSSATAYAVYDPPGLAGVLPPAPAPLAAASTGQLIWDYSATAIAPTPTWSNTGTEPIGTGPTGNGFNEVIFLQNRVVNNGGFCSMDLNAQTGAIIECDVIFDTNSFIYGLAAGLPNQTTAFVHEIGHFFGLDHTNLHPGGGGVPPSVYAGPSWMSYTGAPAEYPGMMSAVTRFFGTDMVNGIPLLHRDDATGLSRIYPVQSPASGKDPLINTTATIRGRLHIPAPSGRARFGDNVFPIARAVGTSLPVPATPPDMAFQMSPVGTISGTARLSSTDVVGALDTSTGTTSSGAFEIVGITALNFGGLGSTLYGIQYDIVAEDLGFCGLSSGSYGEWYSEGFLNPSVNAIFSQPNQTRFLSNDGTSSPTGLPGLNGLWLPTGIPVVGSFSVLPGTIIDVVKVTHGGGINAVAPDATSRPLTYIVERSRPAPGAPLTLMSSSNYPVNIAGMSLTVNGTNFNLAQPSITLLGPGPVLTLTIPATLVSALLPIGGPPARLIFTAIETGPPPTGISFVAGVNHVQY